MSGSSGMPCAHRPLMRGVEGWLRERHFRERPVFLQLIPDLRSIPDQDDGKTVGTRESLVDDRVRILEAYAAQRRAVVIYVVGPQPIQLEVAHRGGPVRSGLELQRVLAQH